MNVKELSDAMMNNLLSYLEKVINDKRDLEEYFITVYSKPHPLEIGRIDTKVILTTAKPPPLIGTICFKVNNKQGSLDVEWYLPHTSFLGFDEPKIREWACESAKKFWKGEL